TCAGPTGGGAGPRRRGWAWPARCAACPPSSTAPSRRSWREAGLEGVAVEDVSERIWPMLPRLARIRALPAAAGRLLRARAAVLNCTALVEGYRHREGWRYNVVRARRAR